MVEGAPKGFLGKIRDRVVRNAQKARLIENANIWTEVHAEDLGTKGQRGVFVRAVKALVTLGFVHRSTELELPQIDEKITGATQEGKFRKVRRLQRKKRALQTIQDEYAESKEKVLDLASQTQAKAEARAKFQEGIGIGQKGADEWDRLFGH